MKRINGTEIWTDGVIEYIKNERGEFERYDSSEDNWIYNSDDFVDQNIVIVDEQVVLKPVDNDTE